jgi:hypothetical protein
MADSFYLNVVKCPSATASGDCALLNGEEIVKRDIEIKYIQHSSPDLKQGKMYRFPNAKGSVEAFQDEKVFLKREAEEELKNRIPLGKEAYLQIGGLFVENRFPVLSKKASKQEKEKHVKNIVLITGAREEDVLAALDSPEKVDEIMCPFHIVINTSVKKVGDGEQRSFISDFSICKGSSQLDATVVFHAQDGNAKYSLRLKRNIKLQ